MGKDATMNQGPQPPSNEQPTPPAMPKSDSTHRDATDALQRKLDSIRKQNKTVQSTSVTQQRNSGASAKTTGEQRLQNNVEVAEESIQERQQDFPLSHSESLPETEANLMDQDGPALQKGRPQTILRATTIDEFLKENGADVDLDGLCTEEQSFDQNSEEEDSMALYQNYYKYVMADIDEEEGGTKKKKTRGHTTRAEIYNRTMEEREEVTFDIGGPIGPMPQSVSNLTSFVGTIGRNNRFVTLLYTSWHAVPQHKKRFMWRYVNTKFILPASSEKWVIQTIRDAWKRFKAKIKQKHFIPYDNIEDM
ncbi:hypothetical protein PIB30_079013, partial [Stylosanthes scabra]|nr:hypothetical protein [Stylosanthes scabra]